MSGFAEMKKIAPVGFDPDDLEGGGSSLPNKPDDVALFKPHIYNRSLCTLSDPAQVAKNASNPYIPFQPNITQEVLDAIKRDFVPRDSDLWICGYIGSGVGLLTEIASQVLFNEYSATPVGKGVSLGLTPGERVIYLEEQVSTDTAARIAAINALPQSARRIFRSHSPFNFVKQWLTKSGKIVYIARNPKDVSVSLFHKSRSNPATEYAGPFEHFIQSVFLKGCAPGGCWWSHVAKYFQQSHWQSITSTTALEGPEIFGVWYENVMAEVPEAITGLAEYIGVTVSQDKAKEIAEKVSWKVMKTMQSDHGVLGVCEGNTMSPRSGSKEAPSANVVRKAEIGTWKDYYIVRLNERFDRKHAQMEPKLNDGAVQEIMWDASTKKKKDDSDAFLEGLEDDGESGGGNCTLM
jgi:hypothetical protein